MSNGISYADFLCMTLNEVNSILEAKIKAREQSINDNLLVAWIQSGLISQAVWGSKEFPQVAPSVKLRDQYVPRTKEEVLADILRFKKEVHNEMTKIVGGVKNGE